MEIKLTYNEYKSHVLDSVTKDLQYQHIITSTGGHRYFFLFAPDGDSLLYVSNINEATSTGLADVIDYETNYASHANEQIKDDCYRSFKFGKKFTGTSGDNTKSCNDSNWTKFYEIDFDSENKFFSELVYKCDNLDHLAIGIDNVIVLEATINALKKVIVDDDGIIMKDIDVSYVNNISTIYIDLNNQRGSNIKIYQKKRTGTGDLTAKGYLLSYVEKK